MSIRDIDAQKSPKIAKTVNCIFFLNRFRTNNLIFNLKRSGLLWSKRHVKLNKTTRNHRFTVEAEEIQFIKLLLNGYFGGCEIASYGRWAIQKQ